MATAEVTPEVTVTAKKSQYEIEAEAMVEKAKAVQITSHPQYESAAEVVKELIIRKNKFLEWFEPVVTQAHETWKLATSRRGSIVGPIDDAVKEIKRLMSNYDTEQDRLRQEEEERLRKAAVKEEEDRRIAIAEDLQAQGRKEEADQVLDQPVTALSAPVMVSSPRPTVKGVHGREVWKARVVNAALIPREYLSVDEKKLDGIAKATKGSLTVPGVEFYKENTTVVRTK